MHIFTAITYDKTLTTQDLEHFLNIEEGIDALLFRTSMPKNELKKILIQLINQGFPKDKMIIHSDTALLEELNLSRIHFKENVKTAFAYKKSHPEIQVGMSTHSIDTIYTCIDEGLDYVFYGHIFPTPSHPGDTPRSHDEIVEVLNLPIPIYAIGGISEHTISKLEYGFDGICAISFFMNASLNEIKELRRKWSQHA